MNKRLNLLVPAFILLNALSTQARNITATPGKLYFTENKGQIKDQDNHPRKDVQFGMHAPGMNMFIGDGQLHYQFCHSTSNFTKTFAASKSMQAGTDAGQGHTETYRMDVELLGADKKVIAVPGEEQSYYENYYTPGCPETGVQVHTYNKITYKDVYPHIDWVISIKGNRPEYEFIVGPGGDASKIRLKYSGQKSLSINADGSITAVTPMGTIKEQAPICYLSGKGIKDGLLPSSFRLQDNILSYELQGHGSFVIDPVVEWGTYYGPDSSSNEFYMLSCDDSAHIYACGLTYGGNAGTISTTGSYQSTLNGGTDAFLVKFDSSGNRIWATYYGGTNSDWGTAVTCDNSGNVYLGGNTESTDHMATPGCQQSVYGGGLWDGFIAKFTAGGFRLWGTYCGGSGANTPGSIVCDLFGHVYMGGVTGDGNNIATAGSYQPTYGGGYDCFLVQYDATSGLRQWGTYYGGSGSDLGGVICSDGNFVYITGSTTSAGMASVGSHQTALAGATDAFVAKFNSSCVRIWSTYYGGSSGEDAGSVACDGDGNIYLFSTTSSDTGIASHGAAQLTRGGLIDAFVASFEPEFGVRLWGTYYGGPAAENIDNSRICGDNTNHVYVVGYTASTSGISTAGAWQTTYAGGPEDGFLAEYDNTGALLWSTYFGGEGQDVPMSVAFDGLNPYIAGYTNSATNIATPGSYLDHGGGASFYSQSFLAKFYTPISPTLSTANLQPSLDGVRMFPIPNNGAFTLNGNIGSYTGQLTISVTDATGKTIMNNSVQVHNGQLNEKLNTGNVPTGIYFLKISVANNNSRVIRFVKE